MGRKESNQNKINNYMDQRSCLKATRPMTNSFNKVIRKSEPGEVPFVKFEPGFAELSSICR